MVRLLGAFSNFIRNMDARGAWRACFFFFLKYNKVLG